MQITRSSSRLWRWTLYKFNIKLPGVSLFARWVKLTFSLRPRLFHRMTNASIIVVAVNFTLANPKYLSHVYPFCKSLYVLCTRYCVSINAANASSFVRTQLSEFRAIAPKAKSEEASRMIKL